MESNENKDGRVKIYCSSINPILETITIGYEDGFMIYRYVDGKQICERGKG